MISFVKIGEFQTKEACGRVLSTSERDMNADSSTRDSERARRLLIDAAIYAAERVSDSAAIAGSVIAKQEPTLFASRVMDPPACSTRRLQTVRPRPLPLLLRSMEGALVISGSKTRSSMSTPGPVSITRRRTPPRPRASMFAFVCTSTR